MSALTYSEKRQAAGEVVKLVVGGEWERLNELSTPEMRRVLEGRGASRLWSKATRGKGTYAGLEARLYTPEDVEHFQADFTLGFERGSLRLRVAIDRDGLINGLVLRPGDWH